jgi:hypothetical protein
MPSRNTPSADALKPLRIALPPDTNLTAMHASPLPFQARRVASGVEIHPHANAWRSHHDTSPIFFAILGLAVFAYSPSLPTLGGASLFGIFALLSVFINRQTRQMNGVPLHVAGDHSISYCGETIDAGHSQCKVRVVRRQVYDEPDSYGVELVRQHGPRVVMPSPYFDHLPVNEAATLAVELAKALDTTVLRGAIPVSDAPTLAMRPKAYSAAA